MAYPYNISTGLAFLLIALLLIPVVLLIQLRPPHKRALLLGRKYELPRGPRGRPVTGNLLDWLHDRNGGNMVSWLIKQAGYGELTTLSMGTKTWVLLNSGRVLNEIIAKRAGIVHERPYFPVAGGLVSRNLRLFLQRTEDWREGRRLLHQLMMGPRSKNHGQLVELESLRLLKDYLEEPEAWYAHHYRYTIAIMHRVVTGMPLQKSRAELEDLQKVTSTFLTSINSSFVDFFPQLRFLPRWLQLWRPHWEEMGNFHYGIFKHWWEGMKPLMDVKAEPSFVRDSLVKSYSGTEEQSMYVALFGLTAGADNPRMTMNAWVMACLSYPTIMQRARDELERVCGPHAHRLPGLDDLPNLPYMCAVVKEVLRWRPTVPIVPQRVSVEDFEFEGYKFPAGTEFLANMISVCANDYDNPAEFRPERWLESKERGAGIEQDLWQFAFNAGRRSCVGYKLAQKELFVAFSRLLYCFEFRPAGDFDDKQLNAFKPGEPFPVRVTVRSQEHRLLICNEAAKCDDRSLENRVA